MSEPEDATETAPVEATRQGSVTYVGTGPGDFSLLTLAGAQAISRADLVIVDDLEVLDRLAQVGVDVRAETLIVDDDESAQVIAAVSDGRTVVRLWDGDFFNTTFHEETLPRVLAEHRVHTNLVPGVSRWVSALVYGAVAPTTTFATLDASREVPADDQWPHAGTLVVWTTAQLLDAVAEAGARRLGAETEVLEITDLGVTSQTSTLTTWDELARRDVDDDLERYLVVGPGIGDAARRRVDWFASKPLFDWSVIIPRTKDDLDELCGHLSRFGASCEVVATMSIEPPRTEQAMERAVRGLVDGRYLWIVFTSPHSVEAIFERLEEHGLDSRALSGVNLAAVGRGTADELLKRGLRPDLEPVGDNTVAGLAMEFPAYDDLIDPLDGVLVPTADVNVEPLLESLGHLGWEVEEVTAYRTVRAAPPPAEVRDRIKTGLYDAVLFTSSTAVRNMIGIAGKPHAATVVAAIGPATAQACEMHGLRVDVVADSPSHQALAEGLARFAAARRADQEAQGLPDTKPSQRKRRKRRKPVADGV